MSEITDIPGLPLILPAQAQKHVTHKEALLALDAIVQLAVPGRNRTAPPETVCPARGIWLRLLQPGSGPGRRVGSLSSPGPAGISLHPAPRLARLDSPGGAGGGF